MKKKHRRLTRTQQTVNRERATQSNAVQTPPARSQRAGRVGKAPEILFFPPSCLCSRQRGDYSGLREVVSLSLGHFLKLAFFRRLLEATQSSHPSPSGRPELEDPSFVLFYLLQFGPHRNVFTEGKMNRCSLGFFYLENSAVRAVGRPMFSAALIVFKN